MENLLKIVSHENLLRAEKKIFFKLLVIPISVTRQIQSGGQISSSVDIPEQTSNVSTVPISLPSTFLIISEEVLHAEVLWVIRLAGQCRMR